MSFMDGLLFVMMIVTLGLGLWNFWQAYRVKPGFERIEFLIIGSLQLITSQFLAATL